MSFPHRFLILAMLLLSSCGGTRLKLEDWQKLPKASYTIPPYAKYLAQYKIALDPGHGGNADIPAYKRGPTGKREAEMNLSVAFFLKEFLERAGASVFMTRTDDRFVAVQDRAHMAAAAGCDFMLSLHHNASENPATNYSAVFYHLTPDRWPISMDMARNIYFGLVDALRLPQVADDGLLPDRLIYPAGFGVLRNSTIPGVLLESSFYSNPKEERRLMDLNYNLREAYGIFLGLAKWAASGVPSARLLTPIGISTAKQPELSYRISDGVTQRSSRGIDEQLIFTETVLAKIDGRQVPVKLSPDKRILTFRPDSTLSNGYHSVQVDLQNMFKQHNFPRVDTLIVSAPTDSIQFRYATQYLPADPEAAIPVLIALFDKDGEAVWDSTSLRITVSRGEVAPKSPKLQNGWTRVYYRPADRIGLVYLIATTPTLVDTALFSLAPRGQSWVLSGAVIDDSSGAAVETARVTLNDTSWTVTDQNGFYYFLNPPVGPDTLTVSRDGYATARRTIALDSLASLREHFRLTPNLGGLLHDKVIILDAALGDTATGDFFSDSLSAAAVNLDMAKQLAGMLRRAGAKPIMIREEDEWLSSAKRIRLVNEISSGWYLKVAYELQDSDSVFVQTTIYPANKVGEKIAGMVLGTFKAMPATSGVLLQNTEVPEVTLTNKTAVEVRIRCRRPNILGRDLPALFRAIVEFYRSEKQEDKLAEH